MPRFSIIVPVLDEARGIEASLATLQPWRLAGVAEVVVADGGSRDATRALAAPLADRVIDAHRGRAAQMNAGARASSGEILLFLHADTRMAPDALDAASAGLDRDGAEWGRFDVTIEGADPLLAVVAATMNARSRLTGIATGDQAIFVRRAAFSKALKRRSRPACLRDRVVTSGRRWERRGTVRTILLMWRLRFAYALGADPHRLARRYDVERTST